MRNRSQKNAETLLLEPTKNKAKPKKKVLGERMRKSRASAGFVPKPLRNYSLKVLGERMRKSRAPAGFVPKPLRNYSLKVLGERMRKSRAPAGFVPKPLRNCSRKNAETLLLEPTNKIKEIVPKPCESTGKKMPTRWQKNKEIMPKSHGRAPSKHSNSSRIRAQCETAARKSA